MSQIKRSLVLMFITGCIADTACAQTEIESSTAPNDQAEKHVLNTLDEMRAGPRYANVSTEDGRLLRLLTETTGAWRIVEIGTSTGESTVWLALGVRKPVDIFLRMR